MNSEKLLGLLLLLSFFVISFSLGFISSIIYSNYNTAPADGLIENPESITRIGSNLFSFSYNHSHNQITGDFVIDAPSDKIKEDKIRVLSDRVIIFVDKPQLAYFAPTGSMKPTFDEKSNAIEIIPKSSDDLKVGDIVSYKSKITNEIIIHRIINITYDTHGWYCVVKGDNNPEPDNEKVRFNQIQRVVVGILY